MKRCLCAKDLLVLFILIVAVFHIENFSQTQPQMPEFATTESCNILRSEIIRYRSEITDLHDQCLRKYYKTAADSENKTGCERKECAKWHKGAGHPVDKTLDYWKERQNACDLAAEKYKKQLSDEAKRQKDADQRQKDADQREDQRQKDLEQANADAEKKRAVEAQNQINTQNKAAEDQRSRQDAENQRQREELEKQEEERKRIEEEAQREKERIEAEKRSVFNERKGELETRDKQIDKQISDERGRIASTRYQDRSVVAVSQEESKLGLNRARESLGAGIEIPRSHDSSRLNELAKEAEQLISNDDFSGFSRIKNSIKEKFGDWKSSIPVLNRAITASKDYEEFTQSVKLDVIDSVMAYGRGKWIENEKNQLIKSGQSPVSADIDATFNYNTRIGLSAAIALHGPIGGIKAYHKQITADAIKAIDSATKSLGFSNGENEKQP